MCRKPHSLIRQWVVATLFALGGPSIALADDSSMNPFIGDSYRYFNGGRNVGDPAPSNWTALGTAPADPGWRRSHPDGLAERDLQGLSSSGLSAAAERLNAPILASAAADPSWRQNHPNGLPERELQALSSSTLAAWQRPIGSKSTTSAAADLVDVAQSPSEEPAAFRVTGSLRPKLDIQGDAIR